MLDETFLSRVEFLAQSAHKGIFVVNEVGFAAVVRHVFAGIFVFILDDGSEYLGSLVELGPRAG